MSEFTRFEFIKPVVARPTELRMKVVSKEWLTPETLKIEFAQSSDVKCNFVPGQYASLVLDAEPDAGLRRELRPYSFWNHPEESDLFLTVVRMVKDGRATSRLRNIELGAQVTMIGPLGAFYLRRPLHPQLVFVATGTGIVPIRSMLKEMETTGELGQHDITLLFGVRHEHDLFGVSEFSDWAASYPRFHFVPSLSRPSEHWSGARGRVTEHLGSMELPIDDIQVYLCGNGAMIQDAVALLEDRGLNPRTRRIVLEKYFN